MKRLLFLSIVALFAVLSLLITLPRPVAPATASPVVPRPVTVVVILPTETSTPHAATATPSPTAEPPVVVKPVDPPAEPPAQQGKPTDTSLEKARFLRVELRLLTEHNISVNINAYGVYSARDAAGNFIDLDPVQRGLVSEYCANGK